MIYVYSILISALLVSCQHQSQADKEAKDHSTITFHKSHEEKKQNAPFSDVVQVNSTYFLSGQVGIDHTTRTLVEGGITAETKQALENINDVLQHHNLSLSNVVKVTVILKDIGDFEAFNSIYKTYMPHKPARTTFAASGLALDASIEIEVIAVKP